MRKTIITIFTIFCLLSLYESASATTPLSNYSQLQIQEMIEQDAKYLDSKIYNINKLYDTTIDGIEEEKSIDDRDQAISDAINTLGVLTLTEGFSDTYTATFNKAKTISVKAPEGTTLSVIVYNNDDEEILKKEKIIGASQMYDLYIPLEVGKNKIIIYVNYDMDDQIRQFVVNRKSEATKNNLEGLDLNKLLVP